MQKLEREAAEFCGRIPKSLLHWLIDNNEPVMCDLHTLSSIGDHLNLRKRMEREVEEVKKKNLSSWTPLMYACYNGCEKTVQVLIDNGASKNDQNEKNQTALMIAASYGNCDVMHHFSEGVHLECEDNKGWTALFYAVAARQKAAAEILITSGANLNKMDKKGLTVSMIAAMDENAPMLELLLSKGSDPHIRSFEGDSTISIALSKRNSNLIEVLDKYWIREKKSGLRGELVDQNAFKSQIQNPEENKSSIFICPASQITSSALQKLDLDTLLRQYDLAKYYSTLEKQRITLNAFLKLTEEDLKNLGIKLFGPRRKMSLLINHWNGCDKCKNLCEGL